MTPRAERTRWWGGAIATAALGFWKPALADGLETRHYVVRWFHVATYMQEDDCPQGLNLAQRPLYVRILTDLGYTARDIDRILDGIPDNGGTDARHRQAREIGTMRGRIDGKEVDVYVHPYSVPDPHIRLAQGRYANGFNLDGREDKPGASIDPDTGERGVDNQARRAMGCSVQFHARLPDRPGYPSNEWNLSRDEMPAWLVSVTGEDLDRDGEVVVTFDRAVEPIVRNANGDVQSDVTFRVDRDAHSHNVAHGAIRNHVLTTTAPFAFGMTADVNVTPRYELDKARLRLTLNPDRSAEGYLGGYQDWLAIYFMYANLGSGMEISYGTDVPGLYYALQRLADYDPDPVTGRNRKISVTYRIELVPAFAVEDVPVHQLATIR